jgi:hypothetical protein
MLSLLLALGASTPALQTPVLDEPILPQDAKVLLILEDERPDHFGWGVLGLGDVDKDGAPDLYIGARCGVSGLTQLRGFGSVFSGRTGKRLYRVEGDEDPEGDAFGPRPFRVADVDGDGIDELAVKGEPMSSFATYVKLFSGRTGKLIQRWDAATSVFDCGTPNGDGKRAFVLANDSTTRVVELGSDKAKFEIRQRTLAVTDDLDHDGVRDILVLTNWDSSQMPGTNLAEVRSGIDGKLLRAIPNPAKYDRVHRVIAAGDVDGDGFVDLAFSFYDEGRYGGRYPAQESQFRIMMFSGRDGSVLWKSVEVLSAPGDLHDLRDVGDLDGDGHHDLFVAQFVNDIRPAARARIYSGLDGKLITELTCNNWSFGVSAGNVGDIDGDGRPDIAVGQHEFGKCQGRAYVISLGKR